MRAQQVARHDFATPAEVVAWLGAVQAQDYLASLWAIGVRLAGTNEAAVEAAIADGSIVRIHALRGTWQYVARADVRWMLAVVAKRAIAAAASRHRELGLDAATLARAGSVLAAVVRGGAHATRAELGAALDRAKIARDGPRLMHILWHAELSGVLSSGARRGKQTTYAALDERVPAAPSAMVDRGAAIGELARRYVQSHAPATVRDFAWWSGLALGEARPAFDAAVAALAKSPAPRRRSTTAHLLPAFDEYLVGYADRSAVLPAAVTARVNAGGGILNPVIVVDGQVIGTWRRTLERRAVAITLEPFAAIAAASRPAIDAAAERYGAFVGLPVRVTVATRSRRRGR